MKILRILSVALVMVALGIAPSNTLAQDAEVSTETEVEANVEINNSNYLEVLRERRAEWQNEERSGTSSQEERSNFLENLRERRQELTEERASVRAEQRANASLSVNAQQRLENIANGLFNRMEEALTRLENIADRIENKIEELTDRGHGLSAESEMLAEARLSLSVAETEVAEANLALEAMLASETPREEFETLRTALAEAKAALRTTKQELMDVVQSIKLALSAGIEANVEAETETE